MGLVFPYMKFRGPTGVVAKPMLFAVLRRGGVSAPPVNMLVDTGSDDCIFDVLWVQQFLRFDVTALGARDEIQGLEGLQEAYVADVDLFIRDLARSFHIERAYFTKLRGLTGILGHNGFLSDLSIRFSHGKFFEIDDDPSG